jgi:hypothetical protein
VPKLFEIPADSQNWPIKELHGMKLGNKVQGIRHNGLFADRWQELNQLGFNYDSLRKPPPPFETLLGALGNYHKIYGDLMVPYKYVIPKDRNWEERFHGMVLGGICSRIRRGEVYTLPEERSALESIGFELDVLRDRRGFDVVLEAMKAYKKVYGNLVIPAKFVVPEVDDTGTWPPSTWGLRLGQRSNDIRNEGLHEDRIDELIAIGFEFDTRRNNYTIEAVTAALRVYKKKRGNTSVPQRFVVPSDSASWPEITWNLPLGNIVSHIRNNGAYADKREELEAAGFDFRPQRDVRGFDAFVGALKVFKELHGHVFVPNLFVVPEDSPEWPEEFWGMQLGVRVHNMRYRDGNKEKLDRLKKMGIEWDRQVNLHTDARTDAHTTEARIE